jgi:hypothetical protein
LQTRTESEGPTPRLRVVEGNTIKVCSPGAAVLGKPIHTDGEIVVIDGPRQRRSAIYIEDLAETIGGASLTLGLFLDAIKHSDNIRVGVERSRLTYTNDAQIARFTKLQEERATKK